MDQMLAYLMTTLKGHSGLVCPICKRIKVILVERYGKFICEICARKLIEENDDYDDDYDE